MSLSHVGLFFEGARANPVLRGKLDEAWLKWAETVANLSRQTETPFTTDDLLSAQSGNGELSEDALDRVTGASDFSDYFPGWVHRAPGGSGRYGMP